MQVCQCMMSPIIARPEKVTESTPTPLIECTLPFYLYKPLSLSLKKYIPQTLILNIENIRVKLNNRLAINT